MFVSRGDRDLGVAFLMHPGSQSLSRGEAKDSRAASSRGISLLSLQFLGAPELLGSWLQHPDLCFRLPVASSFVSLLLLLLRTLVVGFRDHLNPS